MKLPTSQQETTMKAHEIYELATLFGKKDRPERKTKKDFTFEDFMKFQKKLEEFEKWKKENSKKDEKPKDEKKNGFMSVPQITMLLVASFPITAPLYVYWIKGILVGLK